MRRMRAVLRGALVAAAALASGCDRIVDLTPPPQDGAIGSDGEAVPDSFLEDAVPPDGPPPDAGVPDAQPLIDAP